MLSSVTRSLVKTQTSAATAIARRAMAVAAEVCVFTNDRVTVETV